MKLQLKRICKLLPAVLCLLVALLLACGGGLWALLRADGESEDKMKVRIAVVGSMDHTYLSLGLAALETLDPSRYSMEVSVLSAEEARAALASGYLSAYIEIPDGFVEDAMRGEVRPLTYVSSVGDEGLSVLFKDEITRVISEYVLHSQKGVYGFADALRSFGVTEDLSGPMTRFSLEYVQLILRRSDLYRVEALGVGDSVGLASYFLCSFMVVFLLLSALPFAVFAVRGNYGVGSLLLRKGVGAFQQMGSEFVALLFGLFVAFLWVFGAAVGAMVLFPDTFVGLNPSFASFFGALPVLILVGAISIFVFEGVRDLVSGVLLHFFLSLALCCAGGCFFPSYTFPDGLRALSRWLPTGLARSRLVACFSVESAFGETVLLLFFSAVFFFSAVWMRRRKLTAGRR